MSLKEKNVIVTGGSRGLGLGLVDALVAHGARVTVVARESDALDSVHSRLGVAVIPADVTDDVAARHILAEVRPDIVVLNAGATPRMGRLDQISWTDFIRNLGHRRQGWPLLDPGGAQSAAQAGKPRPRRIERRGRERIAALGRLRRRQAHALVYG
jgi:NAD(P)-dependent dehydrogenase (short-subunit alcohol dehydrogenase family)